jgi:T4-like virus tail tube protein gp19
MSRFTVGSAGVRLPGDDPYKSFRFRLKSDGRSVGGFSRCTGLVTSSTKLELVMLERGVTRNAAFASWIGTPTATWGADKRKDLVLAIGNEAGQLAAAYLLQGCWVTKFQGMPNLDAQSNEVVITTLELGTKHRVRTS